MEGFRMKLMWFFTVACISIVSGTPQYADFYSSLDAFLAGGSLSADPVATSVQPSTPERRSEPYVPNRPPESSVGSNPTQSSKDLFDLTNIHTWDSIPAAFIATEKKPETPKPSSPPTNVHNLKPTQSSNNQFDLMDINTWDNIPALFFAVPSPQPQTQPPVPQKNSFNDHSHYDAAPQPTNWHYSTYGMDHGIGSGSVDSGNMVGGGSPGAGQQEMFLPLADHSSGSVMADNPGQMLDWSSPPVSKDTYKYDDLPIQHAPPPADAEAMAKAVLRGQVKRWEWTYSSTLLNGEMSSRYKDDAQSSVFCCQRLPYICNVDGVCVIERDECQSFCSCANNPNTPHCTKDVIPRIKKRMTSLENKILERVSVELNLPPPPPLETTPAPIGAIQTEDAYIGLSSYMPLTYNRSLAFDKIPVTSSTPTEKYAPKSTSPSKYYLEEKLLWQSLNIPNPTIKATTAPTFIKIHSKSDSAQQSEPSNMKAKLTLQSSAHVHVTPQTPVSKKDVNPSADSHLASRMPLSRPSLPSTPTSSTPSPKSTFEASPQKSRSTTTASNHDHEALFNHMMGLVTHYPAGSTVFLPTTFSPFTSMHHSTTQPLENEHREDTNPFSLMYISGSDSLGSSSQMQMAPTHSSLPSLNTAVSLSQDKKSRPGMTLGEVMNLASFNNKKFNSSTVAPQTTTEKTSDFFLQSSNLDTLTMESSGVSGDAEFNQPHLFHNIEQTEVYATQISNTSATYTTDISPTDSTVTTTDTTTISTTETTIVTKDPITISTTHPTTGVTYPSTISTTNKTVASTAATIVSTTGTTVATIDTTSVSSTGSTVATRNTTILSTTGTTVATTDTSVSTTGTTVATTNTTSVPTTSTTIATTDTSVSTTGTTVATIDTTSVPTTGTTVATTDTTSVPTTGTTVALTDTTSVPTTGTTVALTDTSVSTTGTTISTTDTRVSTTGTTVATIDASTTSTTDTTKATPNKKTKSTTDTTVATTSTKDATTISRIDTKTTTTNATSISTTETTIATTDTSSLSTTDATVSTTLSPANTTQSSETASVNLTESTNTHSEPTYENSTLSSFLVEVALINTSATPEQSSLPALAKNHSSNISIDPFARDSNASFFSGTDSDSVSSTTTPNVSDLVDLERERSFLDWLSSNSSVLRETSSVVPNDVSTTLSLDESDGGDPCSSECTKKGGKCLMGSDFKPHCEFQNGDPCDHFKCINGLCSTTDELYACECSEGWTGTFCEQPCNLDCGQHGSCGRVGNNMTGCICHANFTGHQCDEKRKFAPGVTGVAVNINTLKVWEVAIIAIMAAVCMAAVFVVLPYLLWRHQWLPIRQLVFYFQEYEDEDDKDYDAFVSYKSTPRDERFILQHLYPKLEKELDFRLCLHFRDFSPGEPIANNIINAIERSRRTIMILSPSYVASEWCRMEYQKAQHEMLRLKHKIIPIILEDISDMPEMDSNLKTIINTVTYIEWPGEEEPSTSKKVERFWKLLELSMPKKKDALARSLSSCSSSDIPLTNITKSCFDSIASSLIGDDGLSAISLSSTSSAESGGGSTDSEKCREHDAGSQKGHVKEEKAKSERKSSQGSSNAGSNAVAGNKATSSVEDSSVCKSRRSSDSEKTQISATSALSSRTKQLPFEHAMAAPMASVKIRKTPDSSPPLAFSLAENDLMHKRPTAAAKNEVISSTNQLTCSVTGEKTIPEASAPAKKFSSDDFIIEVREVGNQIKIAARPQRKYSSELLV